jgi:threonine/homoserine/homoserine lactone efflux protein
MDMIYTYAMLISIVSFTLATVLTPGPNNIMMLSSGLTFGYKKTIPHMIGVAIGFPLMVIAVGLGIGVMFESFPIVYKVLKYIGISYLLWMAYKIATSNDSYENKTQNTKPFTFIQAALFQWLNPKAWIMAISSTTSFIVSNHNTTLQVLIIAFIYFLSGIISTNTWTLGGVFLNKFIKNKNSVKIFNITMALFIVLSVIPFI